MKYRDVVLLGNGVGRSFIDVYNAASPPAAAAIAHNGALRSLVRYGLVDPVVRLIRFTRLLRCR